MKHTEKCRSRTERARQAQEEWRAAHPDHCRYCNGWGGGWSPGSAVPWGMGTVNLPDEFDPCPRCWDTGHCPGCGRPLLTDNEDCCYCPGCGYTDQDPSGCPPDEECLCWLNEEAQ